MGVNLWGVSPLYETGSLNTVQLTFDVAGFARIQVVSVIEVPEFLRIRLRVPASLNGIAVKR